METVFTHLSLTIYCSVNSFITYDHVYSNWSVVIVLYTCTVSVFISTLDCAQMVQVISKICHYAFYPAAAAVVMVNIHLATFLLQ